MARLRRASQLAALLAHECGADHRARPGAPADRTVPVWLPTLEVQGAVVWRHVCEQNDVVDDWSALSVATWARHLDHGVGELFGQDKLDVARR